LLLLGNVQAQVLDSTGSKPKAKRVWQTPRQAAIRSAALPGLGQIYNRKYWKLPLVYGAIGTTTGVLIFNINTYRKLRTAFQLISDSDPTNDSQIDPDFANLSPGAIRSFRNSFRQNVDYSVLFLLLFWGLNVMDATVDAHLKTFDVNDDLSLHLKTGYSPIANTHGISLVLPLGKSKRSAK
jgi:hypothetical protein